MKHNTIKKGSQGQYVKILQILLNGSLSPIPKLGYPAPSIFGLSFRNLQSKISNRSILHCLPISKYLLPCENGFNMPAIG